MKKWGKHNAIAVAVLALAVVFGVLATRRTADLPPPPSTPATAPATPVSAVDQRAVDALLALPEIKTWSQEIEQKSGGRAHGAVIGGDAEPKSVSGLTYYPYSFMENEPEQARRLQGFYVTQDGTHILVEDAVSGETLTLEEWRKSE